MEIRKMEGLIVLRIHCLFQVPFFLHPFVISKRLQKKPEKDSHSRRDVQDPIGFKDPIGSTERKDPLSNFFFVFFCFFLPPNQILLK